MALLRASFSGTHAFNTERGVTLAHKTQSRPSNDEMQWPASSPKNSDNTDSMEEEDETVCGQKKQGIFYSIFYYQLCYVRIELPNFLSILIKLIYV